MQRNMLLRVTTEKLIPRFNMESSPSSPLSSQWPVKGDSGTVTIDPQERKEVIIKTGRILIDEEHLRTIPI